MRWAYHMSRLRFSQLSLFGIMRMSRRNVWDVSALLAYLRKITNQITLKIKNLWQVVLKVFLVQNSWQDGLRIPNGPYHKMDKLLR
jgi:hypothetical protein